MGKDCNKLLHTPHEVVGQEVAKLASPDSGLRTQTTGGAAPTRHILIPMIFNGVQAQPVPACHVPRVGEFELLT